MTADSNTVRNYVDGTWQVPEGAVEQEIHNPATTETVAHVQFSSERDLDRAVAALTEPGHEQQFGFSLDAPLEIANLRVVGKGQGQGVTIEEQELQGADPGHARVASTEVYFDGTYHETPVYDRGELDPGNRVPGPAIVIEDDSTVVVQPDHTAAVDRYANIEITRSDSA